MATAKFLICAAPSYLQKYGIPTTIVDLRNHNSINFISAWTGKSYDWRFQHDGEELSLPVEGNIRLDNGKAILTTAIARVGIAQLYNYVAFCAILGQRFTLMLSFMQSLMNTLKQIGVVG